MSEPVTSLHYAANGNFVNGQYAPGADGFNLADISSASQLSELPSGVKALVYLGMTGGVTASFQAAVSSFIGKSQVYGFYLADEPAPSATTAANLKAESAWIHAHVPGAKTFIVEENSSSNTTPQYYYNPANSGVDLYGLDPYPVQSNVPNNYDLNIIPLAVKAAEAIGIPQQDLVPVYQTFGGGSYSTYFLPTATQEQQILSTWGSALPNPAFDYAYSWGAQSGDTALSNSPALQKVLAVHNALGATPSAPQGAPAAPTIADTAAVGGYVNAARDTATQSLSGTAAAGSSVKVYLNGSTTPKYTAVANASGQWSVTIGALANGAYSYTATATNAAGATSASSAALKFTVDTLAPAAPTITDSSAVNGVVNATHDIATQALSGTAAAGSTVKVYLNGSTTPKYTAVANASGQWSVKVGTLASGAYSYTATATDPAGNTSPRSSALNLTVNTATPAAPTIADSAAVGGYVNAARDTAAQALSGTAAAGSTVRVYLNGSTTPKYTTVANASGQWGVTVGALANGAYSYTATATNTAGATSASSAALKFTVDTIAPAAPTISDSSIHSGYVNAANDKATQALSGTAAAGSAVKVYLNGSTTPKYTAVANASGQWSVAVGALANGAYSYTATATDAAGNTSASSAALKFTVDTIAPSAPTIGDSAIQNGVVSQANDTASQALAGTAAAGSSVRVYLNGSTTPKYTTVANASGQWSVTVGSLASGAYSYAATATDAAGNTSASSAALRFTVGSSGTVGGTTSSIGPSTPLHYTGNGNFVNGQYAPGADGFNLADISSASELSELPSGVKALVYLGMTDGVTASFQAAVSSFIGKSQVYGFYLADEPAPSATTAANLKAESAWIHAHVPGAKTFIVEENSSSNTTPQFYYNPANSGVDLYGLDPYPVQSNVPNNYDLNIIPLAVKAAEAIGIPQQDLVPVYQAFGGGSYSTFFLPTATQEQQILSTWGSALPNPAFDYAYSWGAQSGDTALSNSPALQQVFAAHNGLVKPAA